MATYDFPQDLRDAQLNLHRTRAAYEEYARALPWSAEPLPGWEAEKQLHSGFRSVDDQVFPQQGWFDDHVIPQAAFTELAMGSAEAGTGGPGRRGGG
ncbi:hypothetical protein ACK8N7_00165 [Streptomyces griseobrunneus]